MSGVWSDSTSDTEGVFGNFPGAEPPKRISMRAWIMLAMPARLPIRRKDLDEAAQIEGFAYNTTGWALRKLVAKGVLEQVGSGLFRRSQQ